MPAGRSESLQSHRLLKVYKWSASDLAESQFVNELQSVWVQLTSLYNWGLQWLLTGCVPIWKQGWRLLSVEESVSDLWMYEVKVNFGFQMDTDFWCSLIYQLICVILNREHATVNSTQQLLCRHDVILTDQSWSQSHEGQAISLCEYSLTELQPMTSQRRRLLFTWFEV